MLASKTRVTRLTHGDANPWIWEMIEMLASRFAQHQNCKRHYTDPHSATTSLFLDVSSSIIQRKRSNRSNQKQGVMWIPSPRGETSPFYCLKKVFVRPHPPWELGSSFSQSEHLKIHGIGLETISDSCCLKAHLLWLQSTPELEQDETMTKMKQKAQKQWIVIVIICHNLIWNSFLPRHTCTFSVCASRNLTPMIWIRRPSKSRDP